MLGLLRRNLHSCPTDVKSVAYKALVRPRLEYCDTVWDPHHKIHINTIEKIQNRAARFVTGTYNTDVSSSSLVQRLGWESLETRRTKSRLTMIYKETHGLIPSNIEQYTYKGTRCTRRLHSRLSYEAPRTNKDCLKYSLYPRTIPEWNLLPDNLKSTTNLDKFKTMLADQDINSITHRAHFKI